MYLSDSDTLVGSPAELARILRCSEAEFCTALKDLTHTNAACHSERNGVVTLMSRRLERQRNARIDARLRKQRSRQKKPGHAEVPSAYASACDSYQFRDRGSGAGTPMPSAKPFPVTVDDALAQCALVAVPKDVIMKTYDLAKSRGGKDSKGLLIEDFPAHVRVCWIYEQGRRAESGRPPMGPANPNAPKMAEVAAYAKDKADGDERWQNWAHSFFTFWSDKKRDWKKGDKAIDWRIELAGQILKWKGGKT